MLTKKIQTSRIFSDFNIRAKPSSIIAPRKSNELYGFGENSVEFVFSTSKDFAGDSRSKSKPKKKIFHSRSMHTKIPLLYLRLKPTITQKKDSECTYAQIDEFEVTLN